ncbi:MAG: glutathione S-transferase family protein [Polyangia bacterium]
MKPFVLTIGDRNVSSWSLRAWLAVVISGAPFEEELVRLDRPDTKTLLAARSPTAQVPVLHHGEIVVWDSLAICEYVADLYPDAQLWPADPHRRGHARAISCELHSGFAALRRELPMNIAERLPTPSLSADAKADLERVFTLLEDCRARYSSLGPYLFGGFSIADCMYAPVLTRFTTYGIALSEAIDRYRTILYARPAMQRWIAEAEAEFRA